MKNIYLFLPILLLLGCQPASQKQSEEEKEQKMASVSASQEVSPGAQQGLLHVVQRTHAFSSPTEQDYFRLTLRGDSILTGTVEFTITTSGGEQIYREQFAAADLEAALVYEMENNTATTHDREAFILKRMEEFVQPNDFVSPAISSTMTPDTSVVSLTTWKQIQGKKNSIGFRYLLGKEDGRLLVYDPQQKKAVRYGSFGG
ncbi:MAG: hypothetical protein ACO1OQ_04260 [Rufibacter sp.]